jgi:hypothetical protein
MDFLEEEIGSAFLRYIAVAPYLDRMFYEVVMPELRRKTARAIAAAASPGGLSRV